MRARMSSARSPLGSITTTPRPAAMSARARLAMRVDFPDPVAPMTWVWNRPPSTPRQTARGADPLRCPRAPAAQTQNSPSSSSSKSREPVRPKSTPAGGADRGRAGVDEPGERGVLRQVGKGGQLGEPEHLAVGGRPVLQSAPAPERVPGDEVVAPGVDAEGGGQLVGMSAQAPAGVVAGRGRGEPATQGDREGGKVARLPHHVAHVGRAHGIGADRSLRGSPPGGEKPGHEGHRPAGVKRPGSTSERPGRPGTGRSDHDLDDGLVGPVLGRKGAEHGAQRIGVVVGPEWQPRRRDQT